MWPGRSARRDDSGENRSDGCGGMADDIFERGAGGRELASLRRTEHAQYHLGDVGRSTVGGQLGRPLVVVSDDPLDGAPAQLGEDAGDALQVHRLGNGEGRGRAVEPAFVGDDDGCGLSYSP